MAGQAVRGTVRAWLEATYHAPVADIVTSALARHPRSVPAAAKELGINKHTLYRMIYDWGITRNVTATITIRNPKDGAK